MMEVQRDNSTMAPWWRGVGRSTLLLVIGRSTMTRNTNAPTTTTSGEQAVHHHCSFLPSHVARIDTLCSKQPGRLK